MFCRLLLFFFFAGGVVDFEPGRSAKRKDLQGLVFSSFCLLGGGGLVDVRGGSQPKEGQINRLPFGNGKSAKRSRGKGHQFCCVDLGGKTGKK